MTFNSMGAKMKPESSSVLITGGTGSLGRAVVAKLLSREDIGKITIFSRDELKQMELRNFYSNNSKLKFVVGDIRDLDRLRQACFKVDYIIHAAALKQVDTGEYNPMEFIKTNILGSQNVIEAALSTNVRKVVALSTDKASSPANLYGATKLTSDKLFIAANNFSVEQGTAFSVVRYGNVMASRGSVIPYFLKLARENKPLPITDYRMTRFWIDLDQAVNFVLDAMDEMEGGELFVPKIPSLRITDLAKAVSRNAETIEIGLRPGEKLHEEMISPDDSRRTIDLGSKYIVSPVIALWDYKNKTGVPVLDGFSYSSESNPVWLSVEDIEESIQKLEI